MIPIIRTALASLRRDRAALSLSFILPIVFFSIFAVIFGGRRNSLPKITVLVVDEDHSPTSQRLLHGLQNEGSLRVNTRPEPRKGVEQPEYTAPAAETAVKAGEAPIAIVIPQGFGEKPISFGGDGSGPPIRLLYDSGDPIAWQMVSGLLQKVGMTSMPDTMIEQGLKYTGQFVGGLTPQQQKAMNSNLDQLHHLMAQGGSNPAGSGSAFSNGIIAVKPRSVQGESKNKDIVSFYAAAIGVMFLLFTASGAAGSLLDEAESGTLERVLSSRVNMTTLLAGKLAFNALLAFAQLVLMFLWAWLVFKVDFPGHIPGFVVMGVATALSVGAFGILLASICHTRAQLGALSTLLILTMSSIGGSMFPRYLMPEGIQKAGLLTINAWAIDGFTKVFWRDEPIVNLWPQVGVLLAVGIVLFLIARRIARRWEFA